MTLNLFFCGPLHRICAVIFSQHAVKDTQVTADLFILRPSLHRAC